MAKATVKKSKVTALEKLAEQQLTQSSKLFLEEITSQKVHSTSFILHRNTEANGNISPFILGSVSAQTYFHEDGELATALAAKNQGVPFIVSSHSSYSIEDIADAVPGSELWFQAHLFHDRDLTKHFIQRAELAGYQAIVVSLSNDVVHQTADKEARGTTNFVVDPIFAKKNHHNNQSIAEQVANEYQNRHVTWDDIRYIKQFTNLPVFIYGDLSIDDVRVALQQQVEGIIFTNISHANIDLLERVKTVVGGNLSIIIETEVNTKEALDLYLHLGADAVSVQRSYIHGLSTSGVPGVEEVIAQLFT
ncbi:alpha-hydroxy-acid oxidizing protein [Gracilibacillus salinarum]|uniref:Alpha-hydroxy-acid oxidizing protein n=1 Tax=Gracilibacillus salinarum TaxID=2932255 RepID=A0ABY4GLY7_9BACI|nr:alpha-hydroxy-acid oxidizing protein [Gracilibacillus salinarum]UOQ85231.1 alpha-hydroxy-acid oxidizing protein [Gracilibacillus salinarum]